MKILHVLIVVSVVFLGVALFLFLTDEAEAPSLSSRHIGDVDVHPISHASFVIETGDITIFNDPVGENSSYQSFGEPNLILISDVHGDHLNIETLEGVIGENTRIIAPSIVFDELPLEFQEKTTILSNGDLHEVLGITIEAIPMYNLPMSEDSYHVKGRGNGYLLSWDKTKIYIAGDTGDTPEMRSLENIDIAFVPMNLPYTMDIETAASAVIDFSPKVVYPYHYRGTDGLSNVAEFKRLVTEANSDIEVRLLDWYPAE